MEMYMPYISKSQENSFLCKNAKTLIILSAAFLQFVLLLNFVHVLESFHAFW